MTLLLHGFSRNIVEALHEEFGDVSVAFVDKPSGPEPSAERPWREFSVGDRFSLIPGAFSAELPAQFRDEVARNCLHLFERSHHRMFLRQNSGRSTWLEVANYFENALQFYYDLLTRHRVTRVLFHLLPHEGSTPVLFEAARRLGAHAAFCHLGPAPNSIWISEDFLGIGRSQIARPDAWTEPQLEAMPEIKPPDYMKNVRPPGGLETLKALGAGAASVAARALILQPLTNPAAFRKKVLKFDQQRRRFDHHVGDKAHFSTEVPGEKFIYFALHFQPESNTEIMGGDFADQLLAVEALARAAPKDLLIAVKENPLQTSLMRGRSFFERVAAIPRVRLIHAAVPSMALLARCEMAASITGTVGWEAINLGKPAITFGGAWYRDLHGAFSWRGDGAETVAEIAAYRPDATALEASLQALSRRLWPGVNDGYYAQYLDAFDPAQNDAALAGSLIAYLRASAQTRAEAAGLTAVAPA